MTVGAILNEKGREVFTMRPQASIGEAVKALAARRIGAIVLVDDAGGVEGILSERDVVRLVGTKGPDCLSDTIADAMTRKVVTCGEEASVHEVMETMTHGRFRHLPVTVGRRLVGIVSIGDVVKRRIEDAEREADHMRQYIAAGG